MSTFLETRAELLKLARVLNVDSRELAFLGKADPGELRELRASIADRMLAQNREHFERLAVLGRHLPGRIAAMLAQHALGAQLSGRVASLLTAEELMDFASRFPPDFLADVAAVIDLRFLGPLLGRIDTAKVVEVARVLAERRDWVTMGAFADRIQDDALVEAIGMLDGEALLRVGFVLENRSRLDEIQGLLDDDKIRELLTAVEEHGIITEAVRLVNALDDDSVARIARILGESDEERQDTVALVGRIDTARVVAVTRVLAEERDWITLGAFASSVQHEALVEAIDVLDGEALLRVGLALKNRSRLDRIQGLLDDDKLRELLMAAEEHGTFAEAASLVNALDDGSVAKVARILGESNEERLDAIAAELLGDADLLSAAERLIHSSPQMQAAIDRAKPQAA